MCDLQLLLSPGLLLNMSAQIIGWSLNVIAQTLFCLPESALLDMKAAVDELSMFLIGKIIIPLGA